MRILMLNNEYPPIGGGTGTVNEAILREFASYTDLDIDLVTSSPDNKYEVCRLFERFRMFRLPVNRYNIHHASNGELLRYAWKAIRLSLHLSKEHPYDLCMAWSSVPAGGAALVLRRLIQLPYIVRVTGPDIPGFEDRYRLLYPVLAPVIRSVWRGASAVIAKCREEVTLMHETLPDINVVIIPNGVDVSRFRAEKEPREGPLRILCVGRLIERKGQRDLIQAVRSLKDRGIDVRCRFVGEGDSEASYRKLAVELGAQDRIQFIGYIPREAMPKVYAEADLFVLPSHREGMSVAALEARAAGLPMVLSCTGGSSEIVREGLNGWIYPVRDVERLAAILEEAARDQALLERFGKESGRMALEGTWESIVRIYLGDIFSALANHRQPVVNAEIDQQQQV